MADSCLCCQQRLKAAGRYHPRCLRRLFGVSRSPAIRFGLADFPALVAQHQGRMSISGVQVKVSVRLNKDERALETVARGGTHILKPESDRFDQIPQNENLCMNMAEALGLRVPPHGLFTMNDGRLCYVVRRFDRRDDGAKYHTETMFQILEATDKYSGSLERVGKAIRSHVAHVGLDLIDFFERVLLCFLVGNGDMHLKNWALLVEGEETTLAPCYDLVCSRLYIPNEEDSALTINGKNNKLTRADFEALAGHLGIDAKSVGNAIDRLLGARDQCLRMIAQSELRPDLRERVAAIVAERFTRLA